MANTTGLPPCPDDDSDCDCRNINIEEPVNKTKNCCTVCTGNLEDNIWFQKRAPGFPGRCILDEMTYDQVYDVLRRNPCAADDLKKITNNPKLLLLAKEVKLVVPDQVDDEAAAKKLNANSIPLYTVFKGNTGGDITG
jgi:hypothetical protein